MIEWIVRPALVVAVAFGPILVPQSPPARGPDQIPHQIRVDAPASRSAVHSTGDISVLIAESA
jgi:hypothetical protein